MTRSLVCISIAVALALGGCASSTVIRTNVPGATVYLNGAPVGTTPYVMTDTKIVGSTTQVRIEAPGYEPVHGLITRNEQFSVVACIGGVFLLVPFLWIMDYGPDHYFELRPGMGEPPPAYPSPPPGHAPPPPPR
jgi:hypothetical protein